MSVLTRLPETGGENHGRHTRSHWEYLFPEIRKRFSGMLARAIGPEQIRSYLDDQCSRGLSASSCNHRRTILNSIFNWAIRWRRFDENPVRAVSQFQEPPGRSRVPTAEEFRKLLKVVEPNIELYVFVLLAATMVMVDLIAQELLAQ